MDRLRALSTRRTDKGKRYFRQLIYPEIPLDVSDLYVITSVGDRLDTLANNFYKDSSLWWIIACSTPGVVRRDSFFIPVGQQIRIPSDIDEIKKRFEELNF